MFTNDTSLTASGNTLTELQNKLNYRAFRFPCLIGQSDVYHAAR